MHREAERLRSFSRRTLLLGAGQLAVFGALAGRLYYLQVVTADQYALLADENRINHRLLPPARGAVLDRNGLPLAGNRPTYRVLVIPEQAGDVAATLAAVGRLIPLPPERAAQVIAEARRRRAFVPITIAALAGTRPEEAGLASGLINTSQQIGGAVGIAILSTIAVTTTQDELASGTAQPVALTDGFVDAFWVGAAIAFAGVLVSIFMVRGRDLRPVEAPIAEPVPEAA